MTRNPKDPFNEGAEAASARRARNMVIAIGLFAFVAIVFVITLVKLSGNVAS